VFDAAQALIAYERWWQQRLVARGASWEQIATESMRAAAGFLRQSGLDRKESGAVEESFVALAHAAWVLTHTTRVDPATAVPTPAPCSPAGALAVARRFAAAGGERNPGDPAAAPGLTAAVQFWRAGRLS